MTTSTQPTNELRRGVDGRLIGGVAAGLGRRFSINPWWFRIAFIVLSLFGGLGILLYAVGWLLIPDEGVEEPLIGQWISGLDTTNTPMMVGIGLIAVAGLIVLANFDVVSGNLLLAALLLVVGVLLYRGDIGGSKRGDGPDGPDDGGEDVPQDTVVDTLVETETEDAGGGEPPEQTVPTPPPEEPPRESKPGSILGQLTVAATLIAVGGLALLDAAGILYPGFVHYVALTLGVVGAGLLVGTLFGRARWLIVIGLLLIPVLVFASVVPNWTFSGETGEVFINVTSTEEIETEYEMAAGSLHVDLSDIELAEGAAPRQVDVSIGAGEIRIDVPRDVPVHVEASLGVGVIDLFGDDRAGIGVDATADTGTPPALLINAEAGFGSIVVRER